MSLGLLIMLVILVISLVLATVLFTLLFREMRLMRRDDSDIASSSGNHAENDSGS